MQEQLKAMIAAERKNARELKELRDLKAKIMKQKAPDQNMLKMIDNEIASYQQGDLTNATTQTHARK